MSDVEALWAIVRELSGLREEIRKLRDVLDDIRETVGWLVPAE